MCANVNNGKVKKKNGLQCLTLIILPEIFLNTLNQHFSPETPKFTDVNVKYGPVTTQNWILIDNNTQMSGYYGRFILRTLPNNAVKRFKKRDIK